jgi:hypothetical protein
MKTNKLFNLLGKNAEGKIIKINLEEITTLPELKSAFKMNVDVKDRIKVDISDNGLTKLMQFIFFCGKENGFYVMGTHVTQPQKS